MICTKNLWIPITHTIAKVGNVFKIESLTGSNTT